MVIELIIKIVACTNWEIIFYQMTGTIFMIKKAKKEAIYNE